MERVSEILQRQTDLETDDAPEREQGQEYSNIQVTPTEAAAMGLKMSQDPPPPDICPFCGKVMERTGFALMGTVLMWQPYPCRCDCDAAREYWEKYDVEEAERREAERVERERAEMRKRIELLLGKSGIKKRFARRTFKRFIADTDARRRALAVAQDYADNFERYRAAGDGLYIEGTNGTGKTHLAVAIALKLIYEDGVPVICKTAGDMLADIKRTFDGGGGSEYEILNTYKRVELLVIDDLGKEQCTEWSASTLYSIINERYEEMRPTIVTTNYNADELIRKLTPKSEENYKTAKAIISRLQETSRALTMVWEDYRQNGGQDG